MKIVPNPKLSQQFKHTLTINYGDGVELFEQSNIPTTLDEISKAILHYTDATPKPTSFMLTLVVL